MHKLAGVVVLLAAARFFDASAQSDLSDCAARLEGEDAEVVAVCPDIAAVIAASPFADVALHDGQPSHADVDAFHRLTSAYAEPRGAPAPVSAKLDGILADLEVKKEPKSLWQLFNEWVDDRWRDLAKRFPKLRNPFDDIEWNWLDWSEIARAAGWGFLAMLIAFVVLGSLLLVQRPRRRTAAPGSSQGRAAAAARLPTFAELEHAPPALRVRLLLQIVLAELRKAGRLVEHTTLTHRQLPGAASGLDDSQRRALGNVALLAERVTYSHCEPSETQADAVVEEGRLLVAAGVR